MTDLNKEREAFLNTFQYYKGRRDIIFSHEHELFMTRSNNPSEIAQEEISNINSRWDAWLRCAKHRDAELEKAKAQAVPEWISAEVGRPIKFGTRVKIKRKAWDEDDNLIIVESEATYDKDSDFCELSNRSYEYETWFDHELKKYLDEDELTHWAPLDKSESGAKK
ncbi:hypothetical protein [Acinetobacter baumannii]|uniref:hypothetical protein n=1 Tax=Acinetobacter baumannii TaxID=470 RepID=UPI002F40FD6F